MADTSPLSASDLKQILEQIAVPDSLADHPLLRSWIVAEYLHDHTQATRYSPEFLIGQALEWQLELWSLEYPLTEAYRDDWLKIFCIKWLYFQKKPRLEAYQKRQTLKKLGEALIDAEVLATLIPGKEANADKLLEAEEYRSFWYSFGDTNAVLGPNRAAEKLATALKAFAEQIEIRRAHKSAKPVLLSAIEQAGASAQAEPQSSVTSTTIETPPPTAQTILPHSALASYQQMLDREYLVIASYRPPVCQVKSISDHASIAGEDAAHLFVTRYKTVLVRGESGIGKTAFLTHSMIQAAQEINLVPIWISLSEYARSEPSSDLANFVTDHVFSRWHPDLTERDSFRRELAQAIREQRVVWLIDGYDELSQSQQTNAIREIALLDRFVLTTRTGQPAFSREIDAQVQLLSINFDEALALLDIAYPDTRERISNWAHHNSDVQHALGNRLLLRQAAELAHATPANLNLAAVLDRAITHQLMTHVRLSGSGESDLIKHTRLMLGKLAWQTLNPTREATLSREQVTTHELRAAWSADAQPAAEPPYDILRATGLLSEEIIHWRFWSEPIRDELAAEFALSEQLIRVDLAFYPQYQRVLAFWAARQISDKQLGVVVEFLHRLIANNEEDPYSARWLVIVSILKECLAVTHPELAAIRRQTEQTLVALWNATASQRLKTWIAGSLIAIESSVRLPAPAPESWEEVWEERSSANPQIDLSLVLVAAGHSALAKAIASSSTHDNDVTHALIDALELDDATIAESAARHLRGRDLANATILEMEQSHRPIQRLVKLVLMRSTNPPVSTTDWQPIKRTQSLALAILSQPDILCNPGVLRWIPNGVIHMLMASLNLRLRLKNNKPMLITADGHEHVLSADVRVPWW